MPEDKEIKDELEYPMDEEAQDEQIFKELEEEEKSKKESIEELSEDEVEEKNADSKEVEEKNDKDEKKTEEIEESDDNEAKEEESNIDKDSEKKEEKSEKVDLEKYAKDNKLSVEEAEKEVQSIQNIKKKYGNDLDQISKAALYALRMYSRTQQQVKAIQESTAKDFDFEQKDYVIFDGKKVTKDEVVKGYQERFPNKAEKLDNDPEAIFEDSVEMLKTRAISMQNKQQENLVAEANRKRILTLNNVPDEDLEFIEDIREIVKATDDSIVLNEAYDLEATLCMARGKHYHSKIKEATEKAYKRGLQESKILGEKDKKPEGGNVTSKSTVKSTNSGLTPAQEADALEMYDGDKIPDSKKFEYYKEYIELEKTKAS